MLGNVTLTLPLISYVGDEKPVCFMIKRKDLMQTPILYHFIHVDADWFLVAYELLPWSSSCYLISLRGPTDRPPEGN